MRHTTNTDPHALDLKADACRRKARHASNLAIIARAYGQIASAARHEQRAKKYRAQAARFEHAARNAAGAEHDMAAGFVDEDLDTACTRTVGGAW